MKLGQEKKEEKGVSSQEREETPEQDGPSQDDDDVLEDAAPVTRSEDRHGQFLIRQLPPEHQRLLHEITLSSQNVLRGDDLEGRRPPQRGEISYLGMLLMMEALNFAPFATFMELYAPSMNFEVSYDTYHEFKLSIAKALEKNKKITTDNFLDVEEPDLVDDDPETPLPGNQWQGRVDPEYKGTVESLGCENKHIILETDDDKLVECTLQWLRMCNKNVQKKIMERVVKQEARQEQEEEEVEVEEEQQDTQEPHVPPGSSSEKEEPVPPEGSSKKEESGEKETDIQHDDTAPEEKPAKRFYYDQDITGNEDDSVFLKLKDCFSDDYHGEWAGFYNQGYPASSKHRHMFWHVKYKVAPHEDYWYHITDDQLMTEYIARHKDQQPLQEL